MTEIGARHGRSLLDRHRPDRRVVFTYLGGAVHAGFFGSLATATIGAVIFLLIWRAIRRA
jgi:hypothetical protein